MRGLKIAFFGSSLVSAYWNGAATYYRGILRALYEAGQHITFYEPDAFERQQHRDIPDPDYATVVVYAGKGAEGVQRALDRAGSADLIVKASGVGVFDELLEKAVLEIKRPGALTIFWDVDAPVTLDRMARNACDPLRALVPRYDLVLTYGGGQSVVNAYERFGARSCVPVYNALDPSTHYPVSAEPRFAADLGFLGNRLPDREARVEEFFLRAAGEMPQSSFILGGSGWADKILPGNVKYLGHVYTRDLNALNCSTRAVLNISRESMARYGFSPATRVFEAAGAGACLISDHWQGMELFLEPDKEVLVAKDGHEVAAHVQGLDEARARQIGQAAYRRVRAEHTYTQRARQLCKLIDAHAGGSKRAVQLSRHSGDSAGTCARVSLKMVFLGLSITSAWGNGHATTYRCLVRELVARGHDVLFLERDKPWYASNRDLPRPPFGRTVLYDNLEELKDRFGREVCQADLVVVGSYVPEGVAVGEWVTASAGGVSAFYDMDTPVTLSKLERGDREYLSPELIPAYDLYLSFSGGPILRRLERYYGSPCARPLYCAVDPSAYRREECAPRWDLGYLGTYSQDRQAALERLLLKTARSWSKARMVVAGLQYPKGIRWPASVERIEHLRPGEHCAFYNSQRFTLNLTRAEMLRAGYSPSVRLFEAAACGTPIISDFWKGIEEFLVPAKEVFIAHTSRDILRYLRRIPEQRRLAVAEAARNKVLSRHTAAHRAAELEAYVLALRAGRVVQGCTLPEAS